MPAMRSLRRALFGISPTLADHGRRGFAPTSAARRARLETIARTFIAGYNAALDGDSDRALDAIAPELRGFAVEGEAMAAGVLDQLTPWRRTRISALLVRRPAHNYMIHVGAGWAIARLRGSLRRAVARRDPLLGWLVADGWGFHQAYFHPRDWAGGRRGRASDGYLGRAVDQGIGRALWFVSGADPAGVAQRIAGFAPSRHGDLWSGIGLAATYAGGVEGDALSALIDRAGPHRAELCQGAAFAATARSRAGNLAPHVELAARTLTGHGAAELAALAIAAQPPAGVPDGGAAYEGWRAQLRRALQAREAA